MIPVQVNKYKGRKLSPCHVYFSDQRIIGQAIQEDVSDIDWLVCFFLLFLKALEFVVHLCVRSYCVLSFFSFWKTNYFRIQLCYYSNPVISNLTVGFSYARISMQINGYIWNNRILLSHLNNSRVGSVIFNVFSKKATYKRSWIFLNLYRTCNYFYF